MQSSQLRFTTLTETLPVSSLIFLISAGPIHKMGHYFVEACIRADPAGDGILTRGPGIW